jgi:nucleotide-binding universal stress UspA family protein
MKILVATDGHLDPAATSDLVGRLHTEGDTVVVLTVIDHPGEVLRNFADLGTWKDTDQILGEAGPGATGFGSGGVAASRMSKPDRSMKGQPLTLDTYFIETATRLQASLLGQLEGAGLAVEGKWAPTERRTARTILDVVADENAGILVIGSHGGGRFEGLLGSTVTKLIRQASIPVVLVRS